MFNRRWNCRILAALLAVVAAFSVAGCTNAPLAPESGLPACIGGQALTLKVAVSMDYSYNILQADSIGKWECRP